MASYHPPQTGWSDKNVVVAILAKDKAHCLPRYLKCLESQTWPKSRTLIYVRTNNNTDATGEILREWADAQRKLASERNGQGYVSVYMDATDVATNVQQYKPHEWNGTRFKVLGKIRQDSVDYAMRHDAHYFVADCDNFIVPSTLETMCESGYDAIAPLLTTSGLYSNFHFKADPDGYMDQTWCDGAMSELKLGGVIECDTIHCTYFLSHDVLKHAVYDDGTGRYEYAILADRLRKSGIPQYMDNRVDYGRLTFADDLKSLEAEPWIGLFPLHPVAPAEGKELAPSCLSVTYGGQRTLRMDVTQRCCDLFLHKGVLTIPGKCNFNASFGDSRGRVLKTLDVVVNATLLASIPEGRNDETRIVLSDKLDAKPIVTSEPHSLPGFCPSSPSPSPSSSLETKLENTASTPVGEKWLIISPHAGLGNRIRALCSGIVLAKQLGRTPLHAWVPERERDISVRSKADHIYQTRQLGWDDHFVASAKIRQVDEEKLRRECKSVKCYTEWMPGEFWYPSQSRFQRRLKQLGVSTEPIRMPHTEFGKSDLTSLLLDPKTYSNDDAYLLLETSLSMRFSKPRIDKLTGERKPAVADEKRYAKKFAKIYRRHFVPKQEFLDVLEPLETVPLGLHVRRCDFLRDWPKADVHQDAMANALLPLINSKPYVLFSDDTAFRDALLARLGNVYSKATQMASTVKTTWKCAFVEFLILALKCDVIRGTPNSSFSYEAAVFGGKPYATI